MRKHIISTYDIGAENHGLGSKITAFIINAQDHMSSEDVLEAIKNASIEYCNTEEGKETFLGNCGCFNIGDFDACVPDEICQKYGITKDHSNDITTFNMDFNEQLVTENDIT